MAGDKADVEVRGAVGESLKFIVSDAKGTQLLTKEVGQAAEVETHSLQLGKATGVYFVRVSTPDEAVTIKVVKP